MGEVCVGAEVDAGRRGKGDSGGQRKDVVKVGAAGRAGVGEDGGSG